MLGLGGEREGRSTTGTLPERCVLHKAAAAVVYKQEGSGCYNSDGKKPNEGGMKRVNAG